MQVSKKINYRLPPEVNRVLFVKNLPFKISTEHLYDIFGKYGAIRQVRLGITNETKGTAFVVYEDIYEAKNALDHLNGLNVNGRYLIVLYYQEEKMKQIQAKKKKLKEENAQLREKHDIPKTENQ